MAPGIDPAKSGLGRARSGLDLAGDPRLAGARTEPDSHARPHHRHRRHPRLLGGPGRPPRRHPAPPRGHDRHPGRLHQPGAGQPGRPRPAHRPGPPLPPGPAPGQPRPDAPGGPLRAVHPTTWLLGMGGIATLDSYGPGRDLSLIPEEHFEFLEGCLDFHETDTHIFVHANYFPDLPMAEQHVGMLRWESLRDMTPGPHRVGQDRDRRATPRRRAARSSTWAT